MFQGNIENKTAANQTYFDVGRKIRKMIAKFGNEMPENLPCPRESIKQLESRKKKEEKHALRSSDKESDK